MSVPIMSLSEEDIAGYHRYKSALKAYGCYIPNSPLQVSPSKHTCPNPWCNIRAYLEDASEDIGAYNRYSAAIKTKSLFVLTEPKQYGSLR